MDDMVSSATQVEQRLRSVKREISDLKRLIQRLKGDLEALERKVRIPSFPHTLSR